MKEEKETRPRAQPRESSSAGSNALNNEEIRDITWRYAGIVRNAEQLKAGLKVLRDIQQESNLLTVSSIIHECAFAREESRGGHWRADFPHPSPAWARRLVQRRVNDIRQPFPGVPGGAGLRKGIEILMRNSPIRQNILARADVPTRVAIREQAFPAPRPTGVNPDQHGKKQTVRKGWKQPAAGCSVKRRRGRGEYCGA